MITSKKINFEEVQGFQFGSSIVGKPFMFSHVYFVDGLLIDTSHSKVRTKVYEELKNLPVEKIYITHYHEDHTGNVDWLQNHFNCPVYSSDLCRRIMCSPPKLSLIQKISWGNRPAKNDLIVKENSISTPNFDFQIIPIPGHAIDMVALYEPNKKWLFSADLFINPYIGYFVDEESMKTQIESIKRILELDFKVMFCAHNPQLSKPKEKLEAKLNFLESFYNNVSDLYHKGMTDKEIFKEMKLKEYRIIKLLSNGKLSKLNMVKSVIRDIQGGAYHGFKHVL